MWYPDLVNISSKILIEIFKENGYNIPSYMRELNGTRTTMGQIISQKIQSGQI